MPEGFAIKAIVLIGPTAIGKSDLSLSFQQDIFEIVSADSVQVYRFLDIGSGKPEKKIREERIHHLIDIVDPDYPFTAGDFCRLAETACRSIINKNRYPLFVGGTGLYIDSFFKGLSEIPDIDVSVREQLQKEILEKGARELHDELNSIDPVFGSKVHVNDEQRIIRGLAVYRATGKAISCYYSSQKGYESEETVYIGLYGERNNIRERIIKRVDKMIEYGFIDEVAGIRSMGYGPELKSMQSIGYSEINAYLDGRLTKLRAIENIKKNTINYAKRQMTWFKRNKLVKWFNFEQQDLLLSYVNGNFLKTG